MKSRVIKKCVHFDNKSYDALTALHENDIACPHCIKFRSNEHELLLHMLTELVAMREAIRDINDKL